MVKNWGTQKITHQGKIMRLGLSSIIFTATLIQVKGRIESKIGRASLSFKL